jgi:hypothetical protein
MIYIEVRFFNIEVILLKIYLNVLAPWKNLGNLEVWNYSLCHYSLRRIDFTIIIYFI